MTIVAIDGPGGSGKSTVARALAKRLEVAYLDTGAMYRALTLFSMRRQVSIDDGPALARLAEEMDLDLEDGVLLFSEDVAEEIRTREVTAAVSRVAAHPEVRAVLVARQRAFVAEHNDAVVEGRDIASVVLPGADLKVFLTADASIRARRRARERAPVPGAEEVVSEEQAIAVRDEMDRTRAASPLLVADGAVLVDTSDKDVDEVVDSLLELLARSAASAHAPSAALGGPGSPLRHPALEALGEGRLEQNGGLPPPPRWGELWLYGACRVLAVGISRLYFPGKVKGREHLPDEGPYVLAPLHRSYVDWLVVARVTKRRLRYLVKGEVWRLRPLGRFLEMLGAFPVQRGAADREAMRRALGVLRAGEPLVVFPEGTRRSGTVVEDLRDGASYLALRAGAPIVPVGIAGTEAVMPRGRRFPRPGRVVLVVGAPVFPEPVAGRVARRATSELNDKVRAGLQACLDEATTILSRRP